MSIRVETIEDAYSLADFIAEAMGECVEVVVHDVTDMESSIVHICNGDLSGRVVGGSTTDAALKLVYEGRQDSVDYVANYEGRASGGQRFRSSTFFLRDHDDRLIGLLCVNVLVAGIGDAVRILQALEFGKTGAAAATVSEQAATKLEENLQGSPEETIRRITRNALHGYSVPPERLSRAERIEILRQVQDEGVFLMKGAVSIVAEELCVSVPTLYKYLQEVRA